MTSIIVKRPHELKNLIRKFIIVGDHLIHGKRYISSTNLNVVDHIPISKDNPLYFMDQYYIVDSDNLTVYETKDNKYLECHSKYLKLLDITNLNKEEFIFFKKIGNSYKTIKNKLCGIITENIEIKFSKNISTYIEAYSNDIIFATWCPTIDDDYGFFIGDKVLACHKDETTFLEDQELIFQYNECRKLNNKSIDIPKKSVDNYPRQYDFYKCVVSKSNDTILKSTIYLKNLETKEKIKNYFNYDKDLEKGKIYCIKKDDSTKKIILCSKENTLFTKESRFELTKILSSGLIEIPDGIMNDSSIATSGKENPNNKCFFKSNITGEIIQFINISTDYRNNKNSIVNFKTKTGRLLFEPFEDFYGYVEDDVNGKMARWVMIDRKKEKYSEINKIFTN